MTVVVVGGGPAGLASAVELRRRNVADVVVIDREQHAGGIPRQCEHQGFGVRDLRRVLSGPRYARRHVELAHAAGVEVRVATMVTGWDASGGLELTTADRRERIQPDAVVLATGCRERPRSARLVPGTRAEGVLTTGLLQQLAQRGLPIGERALIVGAEHVS
ncbi:MAG TPA: FAD-dependent oxidoreductase, partial [Gaiellaceae bacterium]|nr:FAD-dependent oxidoreductase [Gaiellaceae bacterium]